MDRLVKKVASKLAPKVNKQESGIFNIALNISMLDGPTINEILGLKPTTPFYQKIITELFPYSLDMSYNEAIRIMSDNPSVYVYYNRQLHLRTEEEQVLYRLNMNNENI